MDSGKMDLGSLWQNHFLQQLDSGRMYLGKMYILGQNVLWHNVFRQNHPLLQLDSGRLYLGRIIVLLQLDLGRMY
jgi:hypothetical protein